MHISTDADDLEDNKVVGLGCRQAQKDRKEIALLWAVD